MPGSPRYAGRGTSIQHNHQYHEVLTPRGAPPLSVSKRGKRLVATSYEGFLALCPCEQWLPPAARGFSTSSVARGSPHNSFFLPFLAACPLPPHGRSFFFLSFRAAGPLALRFSSGTTRDLLASRLIGNRGRRKGFQNETSPSALAGIFKGTWNNPLLRWPAVR